MCGQTFDRKGVASLGDQLARPTDRARPASAQVVEPVYAEEIGGARKNVDSLVIRLVDHSVDWLARHWLLLVNVIVGVFALTPFLAPYLASVGQNEAAIAIYNFYSYTCHQRADRSWFIFGQQMAYCERDTAIYLAVLLGGLAFTFQRRTRPLGFRTYLLLITPMAIDGFTQLFGWRESDWLLRTVTGALFGFAGVWLAYPYFESAAEDLKTLA